MEYHLKNKVEYAKDGETVEGSFIQCNEFSAKVISKTAPVKQICIRAFSSLQEKSKDIMNGIDPEEIKKVAKEDLTGEDVLSALYASNEDVAQFFLYMKELLTGKDICFIDGEEHLTKPLYDSLKPDDVEGLCGKYVLDFILASAVKD